MTPDPIPVRPSRILRSDGPTKPRVAVRWSFRGRCLGCAHVAALAAFRYADSSYRALRLCPGCGQAAPMTMTVLVR